MKCVLLVTQFYAPEPCAAAHRVRALAQALAARGMQVRVVAPMPSFPAGTIFPGYERRWRSRERDGAVEVLRLRHIASAGRGGRVLAWLSFAALASAHALFGPRYDAIAISTPPITLGIPALLARTFRRARILMDVRDVSDLIVQMGVWKSNAPHARLFGAFARALYARAELVSAVTPTQIERIRAREPGARVALARNAPDAIAPPAPEGGGDVFTAAFVGNMGLANGLDVLLDAALLLRDAGSPIRFVLAGGGADLERVRSRVVTEGLANVELLGVLPRERAAAVLAGAGASVVVLRAGIEESVPTKNYDAFAVGCPVVLSAGGEARRMLESAGAALCVAPGDARALANALERLAGDARLAAELRANGRRLAAEVGTREAVMAELAARMHAAMGDVARVS